MHHEAVNVVRTAAPGRHAHTGPASRIILGKYAGGFDFSQRAKRQLLRNVEKLSRIGSGSSCVILFADSRGFSGCGIAAVARTKIQFRLDFGSEKDRARAIPSRRMVTAGCVTNATIALALCTALEFQCSGENTSLASTVSGPKHHQIQSWSNRCSAARWLPHVTN